MRGLITMSDDFIFVLDTNVFSNIFEASPDYYNFIISCLSKVKDNIYITDTINYELLTIKNRPYKAPSFTQQKQSFLQQISDNSVEEVRAIERLKKYHNSLKDITVLEKLTDQIRVNEKTIKDIVETIELSQLIEPALSIVERNFVGELIDSIQQSCRIGAPLSREIQNKVSYKVDKDAKSGKRVPDYNKNGISKYNDYYILKEMEILAKAISKNIVFVTWDDKGNFQEESLKEDFISETGYNLEIKYGNDFYKEIANYYNISQENITELFLSEDKFDFFEEIKTSGMLESMIEEYLDSDFESEEDYLEYLDIDLYDIEIDSFNESEVSYLVTGIIDAETVFYEYWGRDDDTKMAITSPPNYKYYTGEIKLFVTRQFTVEDEIVITENVVSEILDTSSLNVEIETWPEYDI